MKKNKVLLLVLCFIATMVIGSGTVNAQEVKKESVDVIVSSDITPYTIIKYEKTITRTYNSWNEIPQTYYYEEYNYNAWFKGHLDFVSAVKVGNKYVVTYTGYIIGNI